MLIALAALLAIATVACASEEEAEPAPAAAPAPPAPAQPSGSMEPTGTLNVAMIKIGAPTGLPGMQTGGGPEQMTERLSLMQRLVERETDLSYSPLLMESYSLSDDLSTMRVKLRLGIQFHDD